MSNTQLQLFFRCLVLVSTVLFIFFWMLPYLGLNFTEDEKNILSWYGYGSYIPDSKVINWGLFSAWLVLSVGIFFYNRLARSCFLWLLIFTCISCLFWGFKIYTPLETMLSTLISIFDGAMLSLMYLTSLNEKFLKRN